MLKAGEPEPTLLPKQEVPKPVPGYDSRIELEQEPAPANRPRTLRVTGTLPFESWNRFGTRILPKLKPGSNLKVGVDLTVTVDGTTAGNLAAELRQILIELGLGEKVRVEESD